MPRALLVLALALGLGGAPLATARAQQPRAKATTVQLARQHFENGREFQEQRAYERAVAEYLKAYKLAPRPELLFNVAQCFRLGGHAEPAIEYYLRFLDAVPDGAAAGEARGHVASLRGQLESERLRQAPPPPAPAPRPVPDDLIAIEHPRAPVPAPRDARRDEKWVGVTAVVTGAALVGAGTFMGWRAHDEAAALAAETGRWTPALEAREEAAQLDARRTWYFVGGGGLLILGGGALWWWAERPLAVEATPTVAADRAGVVVRGRF